jgi:hypothetical protein
MKNHLAGVKAAAMLASAPVFVLSSVVLALPATAWAGETAPGSTETLKLVAPVADERALNVPMTVTAEGAADGLHRLFVYGEPNVQGCQTWPYQEQAQKGAVTLTDIEGEPLSAGHFSKSFVVTPTREAYGVCAYLDTTASANPDVFEYGCYGIPAHIVRFPEVANVVECYESYEPWWVIKAQEEGSREQLERAQAERKRREEAQQAAREAVARQTSEEAARRLAIEEAIRRAFEVSPIPKLCRVPQLRRHTLVGVRRLLRAADCRLGRVTIRHHVYGTLVAKSQNPRPGKTLPQGSAVSIVLGPHATSLKR